MSFPQSIVPISPHSSQVRNIVQYLLKVRRRVTWSFIWSFIILNLLPTLSAFAQIQLCPIPRFLGSGLGRWYAVVSAADSTAVPSVGRSKSISSFFVGVVLIASVIIVHADLYKRSSLDLAKAVFIMFQNATATYVILGIIMHYRATVSSWAKVPRLCQ